jgi:hypothetical protein
VGFQHSHHSGAPYLPAGGRCGIQPLSPLGCPISACRWQMWDSATLTTRVPHICLPVADVGFSHSYHSGAAYLPAVGRCGIPTLSPLGCPISACRWQMWDSNTLTTRVPHICLPLADVGFSHSHLATPDISGFFAACSSSTPKNFASHSGCAGHAGAVTRFSSTTAAVISTGTNDPPASSTSGAQAG